MLLIRGESRYKLTEKGTMGPRTIATKKVAIEKPYPTSKIEYFLKNPSNLVDKLFDEGPFFDEIDL